MITSPNHIIVYGTLRPFFTNPFAQFLREHSRYVGDACFQGLLFDLGAYPGATYHPVSDTIVIGSVYDIGHHEQAVLAYLDDYEGVGDLFEQPNEYIRQVIPVHLQDAHIDCWVYLYNHSIDGKLVISSGDYVRYTMNA